MPCVVTSTAAYSKVLSSMENAHIMQEMAGKCSNYAWNWGLCFSFWIMLFEADYAKNYAGILYQCQTAPSQPARLDVSRSDSAATVDSIPASSIGKWGFWDTFWQMSRRKNTMGITFWQMDRTFWQMDHPFDKWTNLLTNGPTFWQMDQPFDKWLTYFFPVFTCEFFTWK